MHRWMMRAAVAMAILWSTAPASASELLLGRATAAPGASVTVPVGFRQGRGPVAVAVDTDIAFNARAFGNPRCAPGADLATSGPGAKLVICGQPRPGIVRVAVLGMNSEPVGTGELATVTFDVAANAHQRLYSLRQKPGAADAQGTDFRLRHRNGSIRVR